MINEHKVWQTKYHEIVLFLLLAAMIDGLSADQAEGVVDMTRCGWLNDGLQHGRLRVIRLASLEGKRTLHASGS